MGDFAKFCMKQIIDKTPAAVNYMEEQIHTKILEEIGKYYASYSPKQYERQWLLPTSSTKTPAVKTGKGAKGDVHMENGGYPTGTWDRWKVIQAADAYTHGGYPYGGGVSVWNQPITTLEGQQYMLWSAALSAAGIL